MPVLAFKRMIFTAVYEGPTTPASRERTSERMVFSCLAWTQGEEEGSKTLINPCSMVTHFAIFPHISLVSANHRVLYVTHTLKIKVG